MTGDPYLEAARRLLDGWFEWQDTANDRILSRFYFQGYMAELLASALRGAVEEERERWLARVRFYTTGDGGRYLHEGYDDLLDQVCAAIETDRDAAIREADDRAIDAEKEGEGDPRSTHQD